MKIVSTVVLSMLVSASLQGQERGMTQFSGLTAVKSRPSNTTTFSLSPMVLAAPALSAPSDTAVLYNMYGDLRDDNPAYNEKSALWFCAFRVLMTNVVTWAFDRYILNADYARISVDTWKHNLKTGFEWDTDRFGMNFFFHPYSGSGYFNAARSNGYNYYESLPFAFGGSLMWEYFGENTLPSYNDLINTTLTGAFLGEVTYRLSSVVLDDRTTGSERVARELLAGLICPSKFFSRFLQGKFFRVTEEEIYQKEPLNMTFAAGARRVNEGSNFGTGPTSLMLTLQLDYGNPFEMRSRKLFDYFKLRADLSFGSERKILNSITGQGLLFGKNYQPGGTDMLIGAFQHYDFWDNETFELGTIAFGGGIISKLPVSEKSNLYVDAHLGVVPLAGNSSVLGPDTSQFRDYSYGGGAETKLEATLNLGGWANVTFKGYAYWIHTYVGTAGDNFIGILKPTVSVRLFDGISLGFEQLVYYSYRYPRDYPNVRDVRTEQKVFLQLYVDNFKKER